MNDSCHFFPYGTLKTLPLLLRSFKRHALASTPLAPLHYHHSPHIPPVTPCANAWILQTWMESWTGCTRLLRMATCFGEDNPRGIGGSLLSMHPFSTRVLITCPVGKHACRPTETENLGNLPDQQHAQYALFHRYHEQEKMSVRGRTKTRTKKKR